ncbi:TPA: fimbriae biosynthesis transcriptional regulator FimZ, partial [Enterobacter kobei]
MKPASVIIMDEHPIVRMTIEVLLQKNKNIIVKLKSGDSHEVLDCIRNHPIDLVILD